MSDITWLGPTEDTAEDAFIGRIRVDSRTMGPAWFEALDSAVDSAEAAVRDGSVRVVVLFGGHPKAFSYGLDLPAAFKAWGKLFQGGLAADREQLRHLIGRLQRPFQRLYALAVPVIGVIHGYCLGGGLDLASACDIRIASEDAVFSLRETRIAIVADLGSLQRLPHIIGQAHTRDLAFTGRDVDATEAKAMGLVTRVLPDQDAAVADATAMARMIAANAPLTVRGAKAILNRQIDPSLRDGLDYVATWNSAFLASEDLGEAFASYAGKRPAKFRGR